MKIYQSHITIEFRNGWTFSAVPHLRGEAAEIAVYPTRLNYENDKWALFNGDTGNTSVRRWTDEEEFVKIINWAQQLPEHTAFSPQPRYEE